ncbi:MAG: hypothetical protein ACLFNU_11265 [Bacteroidales bacterium]
MKFTEGKTYKFTVIKQVFLPEEGDFFLIRHQSGRRLMLPVDTYKHYGIEPNKTIKCRVDKVNCTGKVFLEPKHPVYTEGETYSFKVVDFIESGGVSQLIVKDCFENSIPVEWERSYNKNNQQYVDLVVDRIKKGIPQLQDSANRRKEQEWSSFIGRELNFLVEDISINSKDEECYVLKYKDIATLIKVKYYEHYGITVGDSVPCKVYGIRSSGELKVEPKNPFYKMGGIYRFNVSTVEYNSSSGTRILVVHDSCNKKCGVPVPDDTLVNINNGDCIKCRVIGFRKGRPNLKLEALS